MQQDFEIAAEGGDVAGQTISLGNMVRVRPAPLQRCSIAPPPTDDAAQGNAYFMAGRLRKAVRAFATCLQLARRMRDRAAIAAAESSLSTSLVEAGDYGGALDHHRKHLQFCKEVGDRRGQMHALASLAETHCRAVEHVRGESEPPGAGVRASSAASSAVTRRSQPAPAGSAHLRLSAGSTEDGSAGGGGGGGRMAEVLVCGDDAEDTAAPLRVDAATGRTLRPEEAAALRRQEAAEQEAQLQSLAMGSAMERAREEGDAVLAREREYATGAAEWGVTPSRGGGGSRASGGGASAARLELQDHLGAVGVSEHAASRVAEAASKRGPHPLSLSTAPALEPEAQSVVEALVSRAMEEGGRQEAVDPALATECAQEARALFEQSLELATVLGDAVGEARALEGLGTACALLDQWRSAEQWLAKALEALHRVGDLAATVRAYEKKGHALMHLSEFHRGADAYQQQHACAKRLGNDKAQARAYVHLGGAYRAWFHSLRGRADEGSRARERASESASTGMSEKDLLERVREMQSERARSGAGGAGEVRQPSAARRKGLDAKGMRQYSAAESRAAASRHISSASSARPGTVELLDLLPKP